MQALRGKGHEIWIYTSSGRRRGSIRRWLRCHGIHVDDVVNHARHGKCFGNQSLPTKRPHVFGIHLHIDNSDGVAIEGKPHGFNVCVIDPHAANWVQQVLNAVEAQNKVSRVVPSM